MHEYKAEFIELALAAGALKFGSFELKSGRISPYFFNSGLLTSGRAAAVLGRCYAAAAVASGIDFDRIFGPAYKGIPLAAIVVLLAMAIAAPWLAPYPPTEQSLLDRLKPPVWIEGGDLDHLLGTDHYGRDVPYCFNRKEAKAHGEGGNIVGAAITDKVLIVDDVITAGTAVREAVDVIHAAGGRPAGVLLALDRQEKGTGTLSAVQEVEKAMHIPVVSIIQLEDLIAHVAKASDNAELLDSMVSYRQRYGA